MSQNNNITIYTPQKSEFEDCAKSLAESFIDYPHYEYMLPDEKNRYKKLTCLFEVMINYCSRYGGVYTTSPKHEGMLLFLLPSKPRISNMGMILSGALEIPFKMGIDFIKRQDPIELIQDKLRFKYSPPDHYYLWTIGVSPRYQGQGLGSKLLKFFINESDKHKKVAYLETAKSINVEIYKKFGFKTLEHYFFEDFGIQTWAMTRDPA